jgi:hypothetical protein
VLSWVVRSLPIHGNFVVVANSPSGKEHPTSRASTAGSGLFQSGIHNNRPQSSSTLHWDESFFPSAFQNKAMYISLWINVVILRASSRGLRGGSNLLVTSRF